MWILTWGNEKNIERCSVITDNKLTWADTCRHIWIHDELSYCPWHCRFGKNILLILSFMSATLSRFQIDIHKRVCSQKHPAPPCRGPSLFLVFCLTWPKPPYGVPTDLQDKAWESVHFSSHFFVTHGGSQLIFYMFRFVCIFRPQMMSPLRNIWHGKVKK